MPKIGGPVHEYNFLPKSISLDFIGKDASITDRLIPTGEITYKRIKTARGIVAALPNVAIPVYHNFGYVPDDVKLTPGDGGVVGYPILCAKTTTSIEIKANVSGVEVEWVCYG